MLEIIGGENAGDPETTWMFSYQYGDFMEVTLENLNNLADPEYVEVSTFDMINSGI